MWGTPCPACGTTYVCTCVVRVWVAGLQLQDHAFHWPTSIPSSFRAQADARGAYEINPKAQRRLEVNARGAYICKPLKSLQVFKLKQGSQTCSINCYCNVRQVIKNALSHTRNADSIMQKASTKGTKIAMLRLSSHTV